MRVARAGRIIDLSAEAARALDLKDDGVGRVRLEVYASDQTDAQEARYGSTEKR